MANEIQYRHTATGVTLYAVVQDESGKYWATATAAFEALGATWGAYDIALTESGNGFQYAGTFPAAVPPGFYSVLIFQRVTGAVLKTDPLIAKISTPLWNEETFVLGQVQPGADQFLQNTL